MARIVTTSFFFGSLSIAQITSAAVSEDVTRYINEREPELLTDLLGYELYKDFSANGNDQRHQDILNGKEYTTNAGTLAKWRGLKEAVTETQFRSLIANYIYVKYLANNYTTTTSGGEKKNKTENSVDVSIKPKIVRAWNEMAERNRELVEFLLANQDVYPEFAKYYGNHKLLNLLNYINPIF